MCKKRFDRVSVDNRKAAWPIKSQRGSKPGEQPFPESRRRFPANRPGRTWRVRGIKKEVQVSWTSLLSHDRDSNPGPFRYEWNALPTELLWRLRCKGNTFGKTEQLFTPFFYVIPSIFFKDAQFQYHNSTIKARLSQTIQILLFKKKVGTKRSPDLYTNHTYNDYFFVCRLYVNCNLMLSASIKAIEGAEIYGTMSVTTSCSLYE